MEKYGKDFALEAIENTDGKVAERVLKKLRIEPPDPELVTLYLKEIARTYGVAWPKRQETPDAAEDDDEDAPGGGQAEKLLEMPLPAEELSKATPPRDLGPRSPVSVAPPSPSTDNISPRVRLPGPPELKPNPRMSGLKKTTSTEVKNSGKNGDPGGKKDVVGGKIPDIDELAKRFAALKK